MERYIASVDKSYITLLEKGHIVERGKVAVLSRTHLVIVRDKLLQGPYGFSSPSPVNPEEAYLATFSGSLLAKARVDLAAAVSAISEADEKRFIVAPELIEELDRALLKTIVGTVVDTETSSEMEDLAARSGRTCLVQQKELVESLAGKQGTAIETLMTNLLAAGLMAPTIAAFNSLSREYLNLNRSLGPTNRVADSIIAERFVRVVGELGSEPRILLSVEITTNKAHGNLSRTCACIRSILGDFDQRAESAWVDWNRRPGHGRRPGTGTGVPAGGRALACTGTGVPAGGQAPDRTGVQCLAAGRALD